MNSRRLGKFLAYVLRHQPDAIGITLDEAGWTDAPALLERLETAKGWRVSRADLEACVAADSKGRYTLEGDRIRANQGHSVPGVIAVDMTPRTPPTDLFHGTQRAVWEGPIRREGLKAMQRHHVHLSVDLPTARAVGSRRSAGGTVILRVDAARMHGDGHAFFVSSNGVWHVDAVPPRYLEEVRVGT